MNRPRNRSGFTIVELLAVVLCIALLLAALLPSIARAQGSSGIQQSMSNLATMGVAHVLYALDWDGRQVTWTKDDLGVFGGDVIAYNQAADCPWPPPYPPECQPGIVAGFGCNGLVYGYWPVAPNRLMINPLLFPSEPDDPIAGWGHWRIPNSRPFHNYLNGRHHDPVYFAPNDTVVQESLAGCIGGPCEYMAGSLPQDLSHCSPGWSSYAFSAAAMYHPDVWRSNAAGGFQPPGELDHGFESPGYFQAAYPDLKTHMLEHHWVQEPPAECNPDGRPYPAYDCQPYWFNHGLDSTPVTLFYDGAVRMLPNAEVLAADQQVLIQTGGVNGLWHRGTPFGEDGYYISAGYDGTPLSHHVLTTDGILGRDTINGASPGPAFVRRARHRSPASFQTNRPPAPPIDPQLLRPTPEGGSP